MKHVFVLTGLLVVGLFVALVVDAVLAATILELRDRRARRRQPWTSPDGRTIR